MQRAPRPRRLDLRTGRFFWRPRLPLGGCTGLPERTEVVVAGAGITGALIAQALAERGREVTILDRGPAGGGSTRASTAILSPEIDAELVGLRRAIGREPADLAWRAAGAGFETLERLCRERAEAVGFRRSPSLYLPTRARDAARFEAEAAARRSIGLEVERLGREELRRRFDLAAPAALLTRGAATIDPVACCRELLRDAVARGARLAEGVELRRLDARADGVTLHLSAGQTLRARRCILATGYLAQAWLPERVADLRSSYAIATRVLPPEQRWPEAATIWETARPYLYVRATEDGRAMVGGWDRAFRWPLLRDALIPLAAAILLRRFRALFPGIRARAEYAWGGTFGESEDSLPRFGEHPAIPSTFFALALGGTGIVFAAIAREMVNDWIDGQERAAHRPFRLVR